MIFLFTATSVLAQSNHVDLESLVYINDKSHVEGSETPFTGQVVDSYSDGQKSLERTYKDGKANGLSTWWYDDGKKEYESVYKDGVRNGIATSWHENGSKEWQASYKDGTRDGKTSSWHANGKREKRAYYLDFK
tara:strand:- start:42 stop:443 length:402 start_codon:yes stop_codon:yes gene_type:complete